MSVTSRKYSLFACTYANKKNKQTILTLVIILCVQKFNSKLLYGALNLPIGAAGVWQRQTPGASPLGSERHGPGFPD